MRTNGIVEVEDIFEKNDFQFIKRWVWTTIRFLFFQIFEKALHNGVVVGVTLSRKGLDNIQIIQVFSELFGRVLRTSVGVKNYSVRFASVCDRKINGIHCRLCIDFIRQLVRNDFSWIKIHNRAQIIKSSAGFQICEIADPYEVRSGLLKPLAKNVLTFSYIRSGFEFSRFDSTHFRKIHTFHKPAHSADAYVYAIITLKTQSYFFRSEPFAAFSVQVKNTSANALIFKLSFWFFEVDKLVISASIDV